MSRKLASGSWPIPRRKARFYEPGGPRIYNYKALMKLVLDHVGKRRALVLVPFFVWDILAVLLSVPANPHLTRDQVKLMKRDNVVEGNTLTQEDLGIGPISVEEDLPTYIDPNQRNPAS